MKTNKQLSQTEKLDALRAGLRIDDIDFQDAGVPRLMERRNNHWQRVVGALEEEVNSDRALGNQLRIRRRQVLSGEHGRARPRGAPRFAMGTLAAAAVLAVIGAWWYPLPEQPGSRVTRTAATESPSLQPVSMGAGDADNAEFANNIDFYTWLEQQSDTVADSGDG